jgi:GNAT superfamily N-acetyltransferase
MYKLRAANELDFEFARQVKQEGLRPYVTQIWGWDQTEQDRRFRENWIPERVTIIEVENDSVGFLEFEESALELALNGIYLHSAARGNGLGTEVILDVIRGAATRGKKTTLQVLAGNPAKTLYLRLGFVVDGETETHLRLVYTE